MALETQRVRKQSEIKQLRENSKTPTRERLNTKGGTISVEPLQGIKEAVFTGKVFKPTISS